MFSEINLTRSESLNILHAKIYLILSAAKFLSYSFDLPNALAKETNHYKVL